VKGVTLGPADVAEALSQIVRSDGRAAAGGIIRPARYVRASNQCCAVNDAGGIIRPARYVCALNQWCAV